MHAFYFFPYELPYMKLIAVCLCLAEKHGLLVLELTTLTILGYG
jgi:hypothetical protein